MIVPINSIFIQKDKINNENVNWLARFNYSIIFNDIDLIVELEKGTNGDIIFWEKPEWEEGTYSIPQIKELLNTKNLEMYTVHGTDVLFANAAYLNTNSGFKTITDDCGVHETCSFLLDHFELDFVAYFMSYDVYIYTKNGGLDKIPILRFTDWYKERALL